MHVPTSYDLLKSQRMSGNQGLICLVVGIHYVIHLFCGSLCMKFIIELLASNSTLGWLGVLGSLTLFCKYEDERDAEDALHYLDRHSFLGRELEVEFARGDRKSEYLCYDMIIIIYSMRSLVLI